MPEKAQKSPVKPRKALKKAFISPNVFRARIFKVGGVRKISHLRAFPSQAYARFLNSGKKKERALLTRAFNEQCFGVQIATKQMDEGITAAQV
jgi:hypothetical protein